ncbi:MAG: flagellin [Planctomycetota bacterium]
MGLRINTNLPSMTALRRLNFADQNLQRSLERLSTGLRINRAADDPSGLIISEQLRAQISSLKQATENAQNATNLLNTTEAALTEVNTLLIKIRDAAIYALNTGGASAEQIEAEQGSVDQALEAIDRIAATTRFATRNLLNGDAGFNVRSKPTQISDLNPISVVFDQRSSETTFSLVVTRAASQAVMSAVGGSGLVASGGPVVLRVTGSFGTEDVALPSGATLTTFRESLNLMRGNLGIYASGSSLFSEDFGSDAVIRVEQVGGTGRFSGAGGVVNPTTNAFADDYGTDAAASLNGVAVRANGNHLSVVSNIFTGAMDLAQGAGTGTFEFTIRESGLKFQISNHAGNADQAIVGLPSVYSNVLGRQSTTTGNVTQFGFLSTITSGAANDLFNDPGNALRIIDVAINQISSMRAYIGAFTNDNIEPTLRELAVHIENLAASESSLRDLDFAAETAELTRTQVLYQAGLSVIAQANAIPQGVIQLLQ